MLTICQIFLRALHIIFLHSFHKYLLSTTVPATWCAGLSTMWKWKSLLSKAKEIFLLSSAVSLSPPVIILFICYLILHFWSTEILARQGQTMVPSAPPCDLDHGHTYAWLWLSLCPCWRLLQGTGWQWLLDRGRGAGRGAPNPKRWGVGSDRSRITCEREFQVPSACSIVPLDLMFMTQIQRQNY